MVVLIANHLPPAVRGRLKLWFLEPRANVFVSNVKSSVADKVIEELWALCPISSGLLVIRDVKTVQGIHIDTRGEVDRKLNVDQGFFLVEDKVQ